CCDFRTTCRLARCLNPGTAATVFDQLSSLDAHGGLPGGAHHADLESTCFRAICTGDADGTILLAKAHDQTAIAEDDVALERSVRLTCGDGGPLVSWCRWLASIPNGDSTL